MADFTPLAPAGFKTELETAFDAKVATTGDETIGGVKTFTSSPVVPAPTTDLQAATKKYVDDNAGGGGSAFDYGRSGTRPGFWHQPADINANATTGTAAFINYIWLLPFYFDQEVSITHLGFNVTTAGDATNEMRLGVYAHANGGPTDILAQTTIATNTTGNKTWALDPALTAGPGWVFAAIGPQGTGTMPQTRLSLNVGNFTFAARISATSYEETIVGLSIRLGPTSVALVDNPTVTIVSNNRPWIEMRVEAIV